MRTRPSRTSGGEVPAEEPLNLLMPQNHESARDVLACYYGLGDHGGHSRYTGSWFDTWDSTSTRAEHLLGSGGPGRDHNDGGNGPDTCRSPRLGALAINCER